MPFCTSPADRTGGFIPVPNGGYFACSRALSAAESYRSLWPVLAEPWVRRQWPGDRPVACHRDGAAPRGSPPGRGTTRLSETRARPPRMAYRLRVKAGQEVMSQGSDLIGEHVPAREVPVLAVADEGVVVPAGDDRLEREVR